MSYTSQLDYQKAIQAGYTDQEIQAAAAQNPSMQVVNTPSTQPTQPSVNTSALSSILNTPSQNPNNNFLDFALPTAGAVLGGIGGAAIPGLGETGISEVGGASLGQGAGRALANILEGKDVSQGVLANAAGGAIGGGLGVAGGAILGKILGGVGENLVTGGLNLTKSQLAKYALAFSTKDGAESVGQLLKDTNLIGANPETLDNGINALEKTYGSIAKSDTPINPDTFLDNASNAVETLRNQAPGSAKKMATSIEQELQDNVLPKLSDPANPPTMADIQALKSEYDGQTTNTQFNADPQQFGVNRAVGQILRKTLNDSADEAGLTTADGQPLSKLGTQIMKLKDVSDLASKRVGAGGAANPFSLTNILLGGSGALLAPILGQSAITGALLGPGARMIAAAAEANPAIAGPLSAGATNIAGALSSVLGKGVAAGAGAGGLSALMSTLTGGGETPSANNNNNAQNNQSNQIPSFLGGTSPTGNVAQTGANVNLSPQQTALTQQIQANQPAQIPSFDGKTMFPAALPSVATFQNTIPGQPYSQDQQMTDLNKLDQFLKDNPTNPLAYQYADALRAQISGKKQINDDYLDKYVSQNGLDPSAKAFMQTAPTDYQNLNTLRTLISQNGASDILQAYLNGNDAYLTAKERADPTGNVGLMVNMMGQLHLRAARAGTGGAAPSPFDQALMQTFSPGQTTAENLRNLDHVQSILLQQWAQYAPVYGLSPQAAPLSGNSTIDNILQAGTTPQ